MNKLFNDCENVSTELFENSKIGEYLFAKLENIEKLTTLSAKSVLTIEECSLLTGLAVSFIYKLTSRKEIPHYKPTNKLLYFDRQEIEQWMKQGRVSTRAEIESRAATYCATGKVFSPQ